MQTFGSLQYLGTTWCFNRSRGPSYGDGAARVRRFASLHPGTPLLQILQPLMEMRNGKSILKHPLRADLLLLPLKHQTPLNCKMYWWERCGFVPVNLIWSLVTIGELLQ